MYGIERKAADAFALESQKRWAAGIVTLIQPMTQADSRKKSHQWKSREERVLKSLTLMSTLDPPQLSKVYKN
jgi:acetyl-CoA acetyltransferase